MPELMDRLMGCRCDEPIVVDRSILQYDEGVGILVTTFLCTGCSKKVRVKSRIVEVHDINETYTERPCEFTENQDTKE